MVKSQSAVANSRQNVTIFFNEQKKHVHNEMGRPPCQSFDDFFWDYISGWSFWLEHVLATTMRCWICCFIFLQTSLLAPVCCNLLQTQGCHEQCETTTLRSPSSVKPKTIMQIQSQRSTLWNATLPSTQNRVHKIHVLQIWNTSINLGQNQRHYCDVTPIDTNRDLQKKMNQGLQSIQFRFNLYYKSNPQCHPKHEI